MKHLTKLFDSMAKLKFSDHDKPEGKKDSVKTALTMYSKDGEKVDFPEPVLLDGRVEQWLTKLLKNMRRTMRHRLSEAVSVYEEKPRDQWLFEFPAQVALSNSQIGWASETQLAFQRLEEGFENALKDFNKKQVKRFRIIIMVRELVVTSDQQSQRVDHHARQRSQWRRPPENNDNLYYRRPQPRCHSQVDQPESGKCRSVHLALPVTTSV